MNEHMEKYKVEKYVEYLAAQPLVTSFNPSAVCQVTNLPLKMVLSFLNVLVEQNKLEIKYEIRCLGDNSIIKKTENYMEYLGKKIFCYYCGTYITVTAENIFPVYYLNKEYKEVVASVSLPSYKKKQTIIN